jgi:hypothetical protein
MMGFVDMRQRRPLSRRRGSCGGSPPRWAGTARSGPWLHAVLEKKGPALLFKSIKGYVNGKRAVRGKSCLQGGCAPPRRLGGPQPNDAHSARRASGIRI